MSYEIKLTSFEGPLDLLLDLIQKEKLEITEISISHVADQYLEYIEAHKNIDAEQLSDFLVMAAKLLFIKSKTLLPIAEIDEEEEASAEELEFRLREYSRFKEMAIVLQEQFDSDKIVFQKQFNLKRVPRFVPGDNLNAENLRLTIKQLISFFEKQERREEKKMKTVVSISEKISSIRTFLKKSEEVSFASLLQRSESKVEVVVTFLALLELIKKKDIIVKQKELFSDMTIQQMIYEPA